MKTKLFTFFPALVISAGTIFAESGMCGDNLTWNLTDSVLTISGTGTMNNWTYSNHAPWYGSSIKSITIGNSVTRIGDYAFLGCSRVTSIEIPNSVTSIGSHAFSSCPGLTSIEIPNSVTSIGSYAFSGCRGLKRVTIGNGVTSIGESAFDGCNGLIGVVIHDIASWCNIKLSNAYSNPLYYAGHLYLDDIEIKDMIIQDSVTSIRKYVFCGCYALKSVTIGKGVTSIGGSAFFGCRGLTSLPISNTLTTIGDSAFYNCSGLTGDLVIPNSVKRIGYRAFNGCAKITSISFGHSVTDIGSHAFYGCSNLTSVIWNAKHTSDFTGSLTPFYSNSSTLSYDIRPQITSFIIGDSVEHVPACLCYGMTNLTTLPIGKSVKSIGSCAFSGLSNRGINQIVLPNTVTTIGKYAFSGDTYLETIYFGSSLEDIGEYAFKDCLRVTTMTCLSNVTPNVGTKGLESINSNAILYVLNSCLQKYKVDENWNRFLIEPVGTTDVLETGKDVSVETGDNIATFIWPTNSSAELYKLEITKDGEIVCTLLFNGNGQLAGISFAPGTNGSAHAPEATLTAAGMQFTVTGLSYATRYSYALTVKDGSSNVLASYTGSFGTTGAEQGIEDVPATFEGSHKLLRNGQVLIQKGEKVYTVTGQEVK